MIAVIAVADKGLESAEKRLPFSSRRHGGLRASESAKESRRAGGC